ncbi:bacteriohemerythrin [Candidatus Methylospira mobilis]|uniref:Bacteriohemerythrin n=1 Tax=Candidatus Methylospira mobilis TaxID=1808979 RepID=A0A5Q0BMH1_9GAMM|nr:hemerythrin family protein [Candidatus Methylospira mobilis]QFY43318.1 bacteriohemerythrin [Candidatus Methylospira mobilis]
MLKWESKYEIGNEKIDSQHRLFLSLIIDFHETETKGESKEKLIRVFKEINKYAEFHFLSEENIMIEYNYPDDRRHAEMHKKLLEEIHEKYNPFISGDISAHDVFEFLFEWFVSHTAREDKKLVGYIKNM